MSDIGKWTIAEGVHENLPLVIRYRELDDVLDFYRVPHLVRICWTMRSTAAGGMPDHDENIRLNDFESLLEREIESLGYGVLAVVITSGGTRDFYLYVRDMQDFIDRFQEMDNDGEPFPIALEVTSDEMGEFYTGIKANCS